MTLMQMCALVPPLCRMAADPAVRQALEAISRDPEADRAPLAAAMAAHPDDVRRTLTLLGTGDELSAATLRRRFPREALAFFHLCGQCSPRELLAVLTRCTVTPTAEAVALLAGQQRREEARQLYALQLLWRMAGDASIPDVASLFPAEESADRSSCEILSDIHTRLKEACP